MDSKTIRDKALKGLSAKNDQGEIEPVYFWGLDEEEKEVMEYIFNNPELAKEYFTTLDYVSLYEYFFCDDDDDYALPDNIKENKENYDLWLYATKEYPTCIDRVPNHFLDANFFISVLDREFYNRALGEELLYVMWALGDTNLCSDIHFIKKLISIHNSKGGHIESSIPFWLFNYCSPELLKDKTNLQEFISILSDEINSLNKHVETVYWISDVDTRAYHWTSAINPDPEYFKAKIIQSGLGKDPDIQNSLNKLKSAIEENFQMVEDQGDGIWLLSGIEPNIGGEGFQPIDWIDTMKFLCE